MGKGESKLIYHDYIGGGASGEVFRSTWQTKAHGRIEVAAKKVRIQGEISEQLLREIECLKKLDHKNIVKFYDSRLEGQHVVIITEYAAKGSLYHYLKDKTKLPEKLLHQWIFYLARGINYLHRNGIAHRDLKSPNCVITADDILKICDFGIARDLSSTTTTNLKGTYKWLAPEAIKEETLSLKADIFAFAIIVWEMSMCEEPYKDKRIEAVMYQVCNDGLRPKIPADCPRFLRELMEKCWHADRQMRPASEETLRMVCREFRDLGLDERDGLKWKEIHAHFGCGALKFLDNDRLADCYHNTVRVYQVTREEPSSHLYDLVFSDDWVRPAMAIDVAVSESMPESILVICRRTPLVFQFPCRRSYGYTTKYDLMSRVRRPQCIAANANTAVIGQTNSLEVYDLPRFNNPRIERLSFYPLDLCITSDHLVVMGETEIVVRSLGSIDRDLCRIQPPEGCYCLGVSYRKDATQLYVACYDENEQKGAVYKYTWDGEGTPQYVNTGHVINNLKLHGYIRQEDREEDGEGVSGLSISSTNEMLVVCGQVFSLELED